MAFWLIRRPTWILLILVASFAIVLVYFVLAEPISYDNNRLISPFSGGPDWNSAHIGALRTLFSFTVGMIVARFREPINRARVLWIVPFWIGLFALFAVPVPDHARVLFDGIFVMFFSPALVFLGSRIEPAILFAPAAVLMGEVSYAVYAIHMPVAHVFGSIAARIGVSNFVIAPLFLLVLIPAAWICAVWYDVKAREILGRFAAKLGN